MISSMCTVFAESEVVSLVAQNKDVADIIHGLNVSVASKVETLAARLGKKNPGEYMMTGGVARRSWNHQSTGRKAGCEIVYLRLGSALVRLELHCLHMRSAVCRGCVCNHRTLFYIA